jgi:hypothetical protein
MNKTVAIVMLSCIVIILLLRGCLDNHITNALTSELSFLETQNDSAFNYIEKERLKNNELLVQVNSLELHSKELEKRLKNKRLKELDSKTEFVAVTDIDTLYLQTKDTLYITSTDTIVGKKFMYNDKWLSVGGLVQKDNVRLDSIKVYNEFDVQLGEAKDGLLKRKNVVTIQSKNPHTDINSVRSYTFPDKKKWYNRGIIPFAVGVGLTLFIIR